MNLTTDSFESSFNDLKSTTSNKRLSRIIALDFEENDDTQEKKARKRDSAMLQRGLPTNINVKSKDNAKPNVLNSEQISHHYGDCMKLASENKITAKNAFDLHLIDYLDYMQNYLQNFQVFSSSLDAGAKIYAGRVDLVHSSTYHILTSCGGVPDTNTEDDHVPEDRDDLEDPREEIKNKKSKKRQEHKKTTCTNLRKIRLTAAQIRSEVDPLFQSQAKKFDECGTGEMRLNNLKLQDDNYGLLLDFESIVSTKCGDYNDNQVSGTMSDISEFAPMFQELSQKPIPISSEFVGFKFVGWDPKTDTMNTDEAESFRNLMRHDDSVIDYGDDGGDDGGGGGDYFMEHDNGQENDPPIKTDGENDVLMTSAVEDEEIDDHMLTIGNSKLENATSLYVSSVREMLNSFMDNYGEINDNILGMWAGPEHWKQKAKPPKFLLPTVDRPRTNKPPKTKKTITPMFPDWVETKLNEFGVGRLVDIKYEDAEAHDPKVSTQLTDVCLNKNIQKEYILPPRSQFAFKSINQLMNRDVSLVNKALKKHAEQMSAIDLTEDQLVEGNKNNNNNNDLFEMVPTDMVVIDDDGNLSHHTDYDDGDGGFFDDNPYTGDSLRNCNFDDFGETNQVPDHVRRTETLDINYAKTANRINVKKLKIEIMSFLKDQIHTEDMAVVANKQYPNVHMSTETCKLSRLLSTVDRNVSPDVAKELSVSIIMTCLLHLVNELGLNVANVKDYTDFLLGQGFSEYDMEQIAMFGVGNVLYRETRKRKTLVAGGDGDSDGDGSPHRPVSRPKKRQSIFSVMSTNDDSD